jgi:hypothetical protein
MPFKSHMATRLTRLEKFFHDPTEQNARESMFANAKCLTPTERRARIRTLSGRLMQVRGIQAACGESIEDAAVRALHIITTTFSSGMIEALRTAYRDVDGGAPQAT